MELLKYIQITRIKIRNKYRKCRKKEEESKKKKRKTDKQGREKTKMLKLVEREKMKEKNKEPSREWKKKVKNVDFTWGNFYKTHLECLFHVQYSLSKSVFWTLYLSKWKLPELCD